jgi:hypothetical protein
MTVEATVDWVDVVVAPQVEAEHVDSESRDTLVTATTAGQSFEVERAVRGARANGGLVRAFPRLIATRAATKVRAHVFHGSSENPDRKLGASGREVG